MRPRSEAVAGCLQNFDSEPLSLLLMIKNFRQRYPKSKYNPSLQRMTVRVFGVKDDPRSNNCCMAAFASAKGNSNMSAVLEEIKTAP